MVLGLGMALRPNRRASGDPELQGFDRYLTAERNASSRTLVSYAADLAQLVASKWGESAEPPYPWKELSEGDARNFVLAFTGDDAKPTTVLRKIAAARAFCRFLQREEVILDNPFSLLKGPKKSKTLPRVLSVEVSRASSSVRPLISGRDAFRSTSISRTARCSSPFTRPDAASAR